MSGGCIFCDIVAGDAPASVVYEDDDVMAFLDLQPINPGHTLVVPREHAPLVGDLSAERAAAMWSTALDVASAIRRALAPAGVNLFIADGEAAGQEVLHSHLHVIPRNGGDGFGFRFPPGYPTEARRADLDTLAARLRGAL